ncbi:MAG: nitrilase [Desulfobacterales bacterium]|nr:MAG: nitrilase [Desulfobacterales bacterium]
MRDIRIAAVVCNAPVFQTQQNLARMTRWVSAAKNQGAVLVCFPEMNISGYSPRPEIRALAEPVPGPITRNLQRLARDQNMVILAGLAEKDENARIFASHLAIAPNGILGVYRKLHIAPPERDVFSSGREVALFEIQNLKFGIQLCYDAHFPELATRMAIDGADIIFMPHASPRGTPAAKFASWMRHLPARAFDNGLFIVACNQTGANQTGLTFPGLALVIGPSGEILAKDLSGNEGLLLVNLKAGDLAGVRHHAMRYFLPHRRPEIY